MVGWGISPNRAGAGRTGTIIAAPIWRWPSCDPQAASTIVRTAVKVGLEFTYRIIARERICIPFWGSAEYGATPQVGSHVEA